MKIVCFILLTICTMICVWSKAAYALDSEQRGGKALLETLCGRCHAVGKTGRSPHPDAPPFRNLGDSKLYDNDFGQRLQDGLTTIHPDMPTFRFSRPDAEAAVNYLKSIQKHKKPNRPSDHASIITLRPISHAAGRRRTHHRAAALPLRDAAFAIWRQEITVERLEARGHFPRQWIACLCGAETPIGRMPKAHKQNDAGHAAEGRFKPAPPRQENP